MQLPEAQVTRQQEALSAIHSEVLASQCTSFGAHERNCLKYGAFIAWCAIDDIKKSSLILYNTIQWHMTD